MTVPKSLTRAKTHIRCGSADCDWSAPISSLGASQLSRMRRRFRERCIERHGAGYRVGRLVRPGGAHVDVAG
jgi:hypothetical protein